MVNSALFWRKLETQSLPCSRRAIDLSGLFAQFSNIYTCVSTEMETSTGQKSKSLFCGQLVYLIVLDITYLTSIFIDKCIVWRMPCYDYT